MTFGRVSLLNSVLLLSVIHHCNSDKVSEIWKNAGIVPGILKSAPKQLSEVIFSSGAVVATGQQLNLSQVSSQPLAIYYPANVNDSYTFIMIDSPSVTNSSRPQSQYAQWITVNNNYRSTTEPNTDGGLAIAPYISPNPQKGSGMNRYIILVYKQNDEIHIQPLSNRNNFNVEQFARQNGLGDKVVAGNFFIASADNINNLTL